MAALIPGNRVVICFYLFELYCSSQRFDKNVYAHSRETICDTFESERQCILGESLWHSWQSGHFNYKRTWPLEI